MNLNEFARRITLKESGKKEISIAQVKEVMKLIFEEICCWEPLELFKVLKKYE